MVVFVVQRAAERDARKAKVKEKKELSEREALLAAIKVSEIIVTQDTHPTT